MKLPQFLGLDFSCRFLQQDGLRAYCPKIYSVKKWVFFITTASIQSLDGPYGISFSIQATLNLGDTYFF